MSNLVKWAKKELDMLVEVDAITNEPDQMQVEMNDDILAIVEKFASQGHSGFSAKYALGKIQRLLDWKPITPLTGEDSEWSGFYDWDDEKTQQNKRCSAVFRKNNDNSTAYYINGKVFSNDGGKTWFTNRNSFIPITFPYAVPDQPERVILKGGDSDE